MHTKILETKKNPPYHICGKKKLPGFLCDVVLLLYVPVKVRNVRVFVITRNCSLHSGQSGTYRAPGVILVVGAKIERCEVMDLATKYHSAPLSAVHTLWVGLFRVDVTLSSLPHSAQRYTCTPITYYGGP